MAITQDLIGLNSWPAGPLRSGPMLGEVSETDAYVWAQSRDTSPLTLTLVGPNQQAMTFMSTPAAADGLCVLFHATGLVSGASYAYSISSANGTTSVYQLRAGMPKSWTKARVAFGSCFQEYLDGAIFEAVANEHCDVFVMGGDNCYFGAADLQDENAMMLAQLRNRNCTALRGLIPSVSCLGVWDDHDFGPNDADSTFPGKDDALDAFKHIWGQRSYGSVGVKGVFSVVRYGPVDVFLTDGRYHRIEKSHILDAGQLKWLKDSLTNSTAPVKFIVSGSVVLPEFVKVMQGGSWEGWSRDAAAELDDLLAHIEAHDIRGVIFGSGDLHLGYLLRRPPTALDNSRQGPDYWELASSPLANTPWPVTVTLGPDPPRHDPYLLQEVAARNYGLVDVDLTRAGKEIELSLRGEDGAVIFTQGIGLDTLRVRLAPLRPVIWSNGKAYFFRGSRYDRYTMDPGHEGVDPGYPRTIKGNWNGLAEAFPDGIDAAVVWPNGKAYFFRGNSYIRYTIDPANEGVDPGYPRYISSAWNGLWHSGIDAVVVWPNGKAYFFKGDQYARYTIDPAQEGVDAGYPKPIHGNWKGLAEAFPRGIDGAIVWPNGKAYFFSGDQYVRYTIDPAHEGVDAGYPALIKQNWKGLGGL